MRLPSTPRVFWFLVAFATLGGLLPAAHAQEPQQYLAYNVWYEQPERIYSTNYQRGAMLPAGTPVRVFSSRGKEVRFVDLERNQQYKIVWVAKHHPGLTFDQFCGRLFGSKTLSDLTRGMTEEEIGAIKRGEVQSGMSKRAVLVAFGYPPEIGTRDVDSDVWKYWPSRFVTKEVRFVDGKVVGVGP